MSVLRDKIIRAHGGDQRWGEVAEIMACVSLGGIEFFSRFQFSPLRDVDIHLNVEHSKLTLSPYPEAGKVGVFTPRRAWIEDKRGNRVGEREFAPTGQRGLRHHVLWDPLDFLHYAGTLVWQALHLPFVLSHPELTVEEQGAVTVGDERWQRLLLRYPDSVPTVAQEQLLYCDPTGLVRRADHSPPGYGGWLKVAQSWDRHETFSGLVYATRRALYPCFATGQAWRLTPLLWLELDDVSVVRGGVRRPA